ncbi:alcohol dehydrogenase catalytic domain-containing protein [bacterium]|nr:alcohol dehydrogenase catalytic domain-containing protein [bacterium]
MKMMAYRFWGPLDIRYEEVEIPKLKEGEVLVKVEAALTCGTDVKTYRRSHPVLIKSTPSGFGHEFSGIIADANGVNGFKNGDRVVAANSAPCGECFYCKKEQYNLCENLQFLNGAYAQYVIIPKLIAQKNLIKIPDNLPFEYAAFTEPLANVVHGIDRVEIKKGDIVGICGLGPIGLFFAKLAKMKGAKVIAAARNPLKLKMAKEFAQVDEIIDLTQCNNLVEAFVNFSNEKRGLDIAIECVGLPEIWQNMFNATRKGGQVLLFGGCKSGTEVCFDAKKMHYDEVNIISVFHHTPKYIRKSLELIASGEIDVSKLITATLPLEKLEDAMKSHINGDVIKFLIKP